MTVWEELTHAKSTLAGLRAGDEPLTKGQLELIAIATRAIEAAYKAHDLRVDDLLLANTAQVEMRRALDKEVGNLRTAFRLNMIRRGVPDAEIDKVLEQCKA